MFRIVTLTVFVAFGGVAWSMMATPPDVVRRARLLTETHENGRTFISYIPMDESRCLMAIDMFNTGTRSPEDKVRCDPR